MSDEVVNHFVHASSAVRYAAARPYFHPLVMERIVGKTRREKFNRGLDVACGTGQSAKALKAICDSVNAIDVSADMLAQTERSDGIHFEQASAEALPFADECFDLATVGLAFHWFDQPAFLREAHRVLRQDGWLVIYNNGFSGEMAENPDFRKWAWDIYPVRFPAPARRGWGVSDERVKPLGFDLVAQESFENLIPMRYAQLTDYLLTQTNVIAAVEGGTVSITDAAQWIDNGIRPFFGDKPGTMKFSSTVWFLKKQS